MAGSVSGARGATRRADQRRGWATWSRCWNSARMKEPDANDQHIVNIVDWLLQYAFDQRASDIHIEPRREVGNVRFRIDGVLHSVYELPAPGLRGGHQSHQDPRAAWTWPKSAGRRTAA